jgi:hypothetical protein
MDDKLLRGLYGRLRGLKELAGTHTTLSSGVGDDYHQIVKSVAAIVSDNLDSFLLSTSAYRNRNDWFPSSKLQEKLFQLLFHLEYQYSLGEAIVELGSIYKSINDEELKGRCSDILSSPGPFDRVINQATLVLEDRIRTKSKSEKGLIGVHLVNKALNADLSKTTLKISDSAEEHEGICHICRGIMLAFRHPTHHYLTDKYSREDALKFCAFVDNILRLIDNAKLQ